MDFHPTLFNFLTFVIVFEVKESEEMPLLLFDKKVKPLFNIWCDGFLLTPKPYEYSKQAIVYVWSCQQHIG